MDITIINAQRRISLSRKRLEKLTARILKILKAPSDSLVTITFVTGRGISRLNLKYFRKNRVTDVIAFESSHKRPTERRSVGGKRKSRDLYEDYLGDLVICPAKALENSKIYKNTFLKELTLYIIHGILHLMGYDDRTKASKARMQKKETGVLNKLWR